MYFLSTLKFGTRVTCVCVCVGAAWAGGAATPPLVCERVWWDRLQGRGDAHVGGQVWGPDPPLPVPLQAPALTCPDPAPPSAQPNCGEPWTEAIFSSPEGYCELLATNLVGVWGRYRGGWGVQIGGQGVIEGGEAEMSGAGGCVCACGEGGGQGTPWP